MQRRISLSILILLLSISLGGCAQYVANQIVHPTRASSEMANAASFMDAMLLTPHNDCANPCIHYVAGQPWTDTDPARSFELTLALNAQSKPDSIVQQQRQMQGTVILLHGYSANWTWMMPWGLYFQSRGFNTLIPDMPAHGSTSVSEFSYGVRDNHYLKPWLQQLNPPRPWIVVGHSMGAIAASYLAADIDANALVLIAPTSPLPEASKSAAYAFHPVLSQLIPDSSIDAGSEQALKILRLGKADTDIRNILHNWQRPTILFTADNDGVIGNDWPAKLTGLKFEQHQLSATHASILQPTSTAQQLMDNWLVRLLQKPAH
ncbi:alpha/beta fold hydrolase [Shewanella avicenniae]|uniref:Alpha/beta fold hydrolase n=1 Tax=Shewanella avicenniae TaxID=2814294 RepID=A0ABX7QPA8_9GAMM|nr:alpha/beta fold hydrolase [Shewanella avicenniae]QSX32815.1 alpha/beta fold hydrolase [Shewanella avicenniae]